MTVNALRAFQAGQGAAGAAFRPVPPAPLRPHEVRVKVRAVSASHLDLGVLAGTIPGVSLPVTLGTDPAGQVVEIGPGTAPDLLGQAVVVKPNVFCGRCDDCRAGAEADCPHQRIIGVHRDGGAADQVVVPARVVFPTPRTPAALACATIHTFPVALHMLRAAIGADNLAGRTVLVVGGAGAVGSAAVQLVSAIGGHPLAVARRASHQSVLKVFGAAHAFDPADGPLVDQVRAVLPGGADVVLETTGSGELGSAAFACLARRGSFVTCSARPGEQLRIPLDDLYRGRRRVIGSAASDVRDVRTALDMVAEGVVEPAIDVILPLIRFADGYAELARPGRTGKVVFEVGS